MKNLKTGALIAFAAGGLFAAACSKNQPVAQPAPANTVEAPGGASGPAAPPTTEHAMPDPADGEHTSEAAGEPHGCGGCGGGCGGPPPEQKAAKVDCGGVNACKGKSSCKTDKHGCAGQNACKGQGVVAMTEAECQAKGGKVNPFKH